LSDRVINQLAGIGIVSFSTTNTQALKKTHLVQDLSVLHCVSAEPVPLGEEAMSVDKQFCCFEGF